MIFKVLRYNPEEDKEGYYQEYNLPITKEDRFTAMDALKYIHYNLDSTLSFFSHSVCNHGICGRCLMTINNKPKLACTCLLEEETYEIGPRMGQVVKDLVVKY